MCLEFKKMAMFWKIEMKSHGTQPIIKVLLRIFSLTSIIEHAAGHFITSFGIRGLVYCDCLYIIPVIYDRVM